MTLDTDDRSDDDLNELGRLELADELETIERAKADLLNEIDVVISRVRAAGPRYFNRWDRARRAQCLTIDEVVDDFRANVEASFNDLIDADEMRRVRALAEGEST